MRGRGRSPLWTICRDTVCPRRPPRRLAGRDRPGLRRENVALGRKRPPGLCTELTEQPTRRMVHLVNYRAEQPARASWSAWKFRRSPRRVRRAGQPGARRRSARGVPAASGHVVFTVPQVRVYEIARSSRYERYPLPRKASPAAARDGLSFPATGRAHGGSGASPGWLAAAAAHAGRRRRTGRRSGLPFRRPVDPFQLDPWRQDRDLAYSGRRHEARGFATATRRNGRPTAKRSCFAATSSFSPAICKAAVNA